MPTDRRTEHGRRWGPPWAADGRRPPWWPEGEPFPPENAEAWRGMRRRFMRRMIGFAVAFMVLMAVLIVGLAWLFGTLVGQQVLTGVAPLAAFVLIVVIVIRLARGIGGTAAPLGDLIEAAAKVEAGQLGVQVDVRGPREMRALSNAFNQMSSRLAADTAERRRFLADVSHELRTPLTVIQGNIEGMLDGLYPADHEHLQRLLAETRHLERLVDDLRTLALTDAGALELHREPIDLGSLAADVVAGFEPQAAEAGVELDVDAGGVPTMSLDARRLRQVIANLVSNAVRHTPPGGRATVRVRRAGPAVELEVSDTGRGMDPESVERAFDRFWRSGDTAGAGLGLAIVRDLVRAHGGEVSLESTPEAGTVVRCRFPL